MRQCTPLLAAVLAAACSTRTTPPAAPAEAPEAEAPVAEAPPPATDTPAADTIETSAGPVTIRPLAHATFVMEHGDRTWVVDPWSDAPIEGVQADVVLLTDIHPDHLDPEALAAVRTDETTVVGPQAAADQVDVDVVLANGETGEVAGVTLTAVPMYNLERGPEEGTVYHERGRGNGYVLQLGDTRLYIAGDTECTDEMRALEDIDVAFVPMNLPYTMPPEEAAACIRAFAPDVVYPYHYRDADLSVLQQALEDTDVEVRLREWYPDA